MVRCTSLAMLVFLPAVALAAGPGELATLPLKGMPGDVLSAGDLCDKGNIFTALKVVRSYRDNQAFAWKHFEGKTLDISGRLVGVKRDKIVVNDVVVFDGFVALITPDGKPPKPIGLEFRFPISELQANPELACEVAELFPSQFVTLRGVCAGPITEGEYVAVIFNNATIVH